MSNLKLIDFSNGIKSEEVQFNFNALQEQINRERKNVGGAGIASGLEVTPIVNNSEFAIEISEASIISNEGEEIHIPKRRIAIEPPKLSKEIEYLTCNASNQATLKHVPYSLNRRSTVETSGMFLPNASGVEIKYTDSMAEDDYIRIRTVNGQTLSLSGITRRNIIVTYNYTGKRIDTIYIDKNDKVKVISSTTSPTPSIMLPKEYKYLIAFLEVDGMYTNKDNEAIYANIILREDLRKVRNIYTDSNGELWLCGIPFKDLQVIHMVEPKDPKENTLWYDTFTNKLKAWKTTDKLIYMNEYIVTTDYTNNPQASKDYPTDMYYYVDKNQLEVYVNDVKLDENQFDELVNGMPSHITDHKEKIMSNSFRIYSELKIGDKIVYKISNFDAHEMWVPVNHSSYVNVKDMKMFSPDSEPTNKNYYATEKAISLGKDKSNYPYMYQYFIFDRIKDLNMLYTPGKHELSLMVNQVNLHSDQFEEITVYDLYGQMLPESILNAAAKYYNWDRESLMKISGDYENTGIGFKLKQPLDVPLEEESNGAMDLYVEAIVERRVNDGPLKRKFQRSATFINEETIKATKAIVDLKEGYYRYGEHQLEVFLDGIKLSNEKDYIEGTDLNDKEETDQDGNVIAPAPRRRGARTRQFTLKVPFQNKDLTYKITTSIYTYEHVTELLQDMDYNAMTAVKKVEELYDKTTAIQDKVEGNMNELIEEIKEIKDIANDLDGKFLTKDSVISISQMPPQIVSNSVQSLSHITSSITYNAGTKIYSIKEDCREEDFVVAIKRDVVNQIDKLLIRGVDYTIYNSYGADNVYEDTLISISDSIAPLINTGDIIILTGIKFGKAGRK